MRQYLENHLTFKMNFYAISVLFCCYCTVSAVSTENTVTETICVGNVSTSSLYIRLQPSTGATAVGSLFRNDVVSIQTRTTGETVSGDITTSNWFFVENGWVSAAFISIRQANVSWCAAREHPDICYGIIQATSLYIRSQPNTQSAIVGSLIYGDDVHPIGRVAGEVVNGEKYWFMLSNGYISAGYVWIIANSETESWCGTGMP
ncbi:hypothetical protein Bhyg_17890 [Pseudolycoriella hygida]|uniref:SH3b domain-containing protein n=1 Tax=Pseudolycoriella hygida TaxID=35572 RepID=A0A9Q0RUT0_9DIPT|nr:hypothetical protein Bhyg_17890 [Pseudolycoriella hygida]